MANLLTFAILQPVGPVPPGDLEGVTGDLSELAHSDFVMRLRSLPERFPGVHWEGAVETESRGLVFYEVDDDGLHSAEVLLSLKPDAVWPPARSSDDDSVVLTCEDGSAREVAAALEEASPEEELLLTETTVRLPTRFDGRTELEEALARVAPHVHGTHAKICDVSMSERYGVILTSAGARVQRLHFVVDGDDEWTLRFRALVAASESEPGAED